MDVFLDLDGTLTDNSIGIMASVEHALTHLDEPVPSRKELLAWIGPPLKNSFQAHLGSEEKAARAIALYRERYRETGLFENEVYDGIPEMMDHLVARGARLHLATSKPRVFAERIVAHFGLDTRLSSVFGSELDGHNSEKAELLKYAKETLGVAGGIMLGDRCYDMTGALAADCKAIGALWGFGSREELTDAGAHRLAGTPSEAATAIDEALQ
ncbi:MAG: HAD hydrolase-like protein [Pseudomonadota bacterium]